METNSLEAFHEEVVSLQARIGSAKRQIGELDVPNIRKHIEVACLDMIYLQELEMLRGYFDVWGD